MKKILFLALLFSISLARPVPLFAVASASHKTVFLKKTAPSKTSSKILKKKIRKEKRFKKLTQKLKKKLGRLHKKGRSEASVNLGVIGLIVLIIGGLFVLLGLVIPVVGILFTVLGIIIGVIGLILLILLGGMKVSG